MPSDSESSALVPTQETALSELDLFMASISGMSRRRQYFEYARYMAREHPKMELAASTIFGIFFGWLFGGGNWLASIGVGSFTFCGVLVSLFLLYWLFAPAAFHKQSELKLRETRVLLDAEKSKNAEPKLAGRIDCLDIDVNWDFENYGVDEEVPFKLKACFTLNATLWNENPTATTVSDFTLWLLWNNNEYQADRLPVEDFFVMHTFPRSDALGYGYDVRPEQLVGFPTNVEITNHNHKSGWLRFLARQVPAEAGDSAILRKDVTWKLYAHDRKGQQYKIYEGTWDLPVCGSIEKTVH